MNKHISLLPYTPNTMAHFRQDIMVDTASLLHKALQKQLNDQLPALTQAGEEMSYLEAFEALRMFRQLSKEQENITSQEEKSHMAEVEVEWCLDILSRLQRAGKLDLDNE
jgi:hypothetical protein